MDDAAYVMENDPAFFGREFLGLDRWAFQDDIHEAIRDHRRVAIPTGNSMGKTCAVAAEICEWITLNPTGRVIVAGPTEDQVKGGMWQEIERFYYAAAGRGRPLGGQFGTVLWRLGNRHDVKIVPLSASERTRAISAIQGRRGDKVFIIIDEAQGVADKQIWDALESLLTAEGSRLVVLGNPLFASGPFFEACEDREEFHVVTASAFDHPNVISGTEQIPGAITRLWVEERREQWGEDSPQWQARVLGIFPEDATNQITTKGWLMRNLGLMRPRVRARRGLALDVARFGSDSSVLGYWNEERELVRVDEWQGHRTTETADRIRVAQQEYGVEGRDIRVDVGGIGGGVVDDLARDDIMVDAVDFGAGPAQDWPELLAWDSKFANRRAELHWAFRMAIYHGLVTIPRRFKRVWSDIAAPTYTYDRRGRILVEDKEQIRRRIGRSPDHGDMAVLSLSRIGSRQPEAFRL